MKFKRNIKYYSVLAVFTAAAAFLPLWGEEGGAQIVFDEPTFDFGVVIQGATVQHNFRFSNDGEETLVISTVTSSCGCTAALISGREVEPGRNSEIRVTYDSSGKVGKVVKHVRVRSNDSKSPVVHLSLQGLVAGSDHPEMTGSQNLFQGSCRSCHVDRGFGKTGKLLFKADCAMCHEPLPATGELIAPSVEDMAHYRAKYLTKSIAKGIKNSSMPAFHKNKGGPLTERDIASLVKYIKSYLKK